MGRSDGPSSTASSTPTTDEGDAYLLEVSRADPQSSTVAEASGLQPGAVRSLAIRGPGGLREPAGALDIERAEALILEVAKECARCPVNRRCPQQVCRYWRIEQEAQAALEREGIPSPTTIDRAFHGKPDGETQEPVPA